MHQCALAETGRRPSMRGLLPISPLDGAGCQARHDLPVEEHVHDQWWDGDEQDVHEEQVPRCLVLAKEVVQRQLDGRVLFAGREVQRVGEVVED